MLSAIAEYGEFTGQVAPNLNLTDIVQEMIHGFNAVIHADPAGLDTNLGLTTAGQFGYLTGANVNDPDRCDHICYQVVTYISLLMKRDATIFKDVQFGEDDQDSPDPTLH